MTQYVKYSPFVRKQAARLVVDNLLSLNLGKNQRRMLEAFLKYYKTYTAWVFSSAPSKNQRIVESLFRRNLIVDNGKGYYDPAPDLIEKYDIYLEFYAKQEANA